MAALFFWVLVGLVPLSKPFTNSNNWSWIINLPLRLHATFMPILRTVGNTINAAHSQILEPGASNNPPDPHEHFMFCNFVMEEGTHGSSEPMYLLFFN
eukprot:221547-Pelagomonas_calceolata.AAC.3